MVSKEDLEDLRIWLANDYRIGFAWMSLLIMTMVIMLMVVMYKVY